jgi:hypothetical protein
VQALTAQCTSHLKRTTVFADMLKPDYEGNIALDFAERSAFFAGTKFWRDMLEMLEQDDHRLLQRYLSDLNALKPADRTKVVRSLATCAEYATGTIMAFLVILARSPGCRGCNEFFEELHAVFRERLTSIPYAALNFIELFYRRPRLVNRYLSSGGTESAQELSELLDTEIWDPEVAQWRDKLASLVSAHSRTSRYFRRYLERSGDTYPACLTELDNQSSLRDISRGVLAGVELEDDLEAKKQRLGDFYDLEFMRIGLSALGGAHAPRVDAEFTEVADVYLSKLFDICRQEIDEIVHFRVATHDLLAVYATGGLGREQAFDDDFDLMLLLNTSHEQVRAYADKIVAKMNAEIIKRGTLPHYRFADHFGHYVTTLDELGNFLAEEREDLFIDKSQILEARMIVGTHRFAADFQSKIIEPYVFATPREYVSQMRQELESRRADAAARGLSSDNVKDGVGGLRDILMLLLMYKAICRLSEPVNSKLLAAVSAIDRRHRAELAFLSGALEFYRNLRNAYRMAVGAEDKLRPEYLHVVASALGLKYSDENEARERLLAAYHGCTTQVAEIVTLVARGLEHSLEHRAGV